MDENKDLIPTESPAPGEEQKVPGNGVRHTWVTDLYDRMNISVRTLDIMLVILALFIIAVFIFAPKSH